MTTTNPIHDALGLGPIPVEDDQSLPVEYDEPEVLSVDESDDETLRDIETARKNIEQIIGLGGDSLEEIISLAKQSESPRAFEVASTLMKTLLDANKQFVETAEKKKEAKSTKDKTNNVTNVTNNNLVLSTAELLKMMKGDD